MVLYKIWEKYTNTHFYNIKLLKLFQRTTLYIDLYQNAANRHELNILYFKHYMNKQSMQSGNLSGYS